MKTWKYGEFIFHGETGILFWGLKGEILCFMGDLFVC